MNLKELRKKKGYSQQETARLLNMSQTGYNSYETGRTEPNIETLIKLAKLFNTTVDNIISNENTTNTFTNLQPHQQELVNKIATLNQIECIKVDAYIEGLKTGAVEHQQEKLLNKFKG